MKYIASFLLLFCLIAHADIKERTQKAALVDITTTGIGLTLGAIEANPIGLGTIPLKVVLLAHSETLPEGEKQELQAGMTALWSGAAANNLCVIISILSKGTFSLVCFIFGISVGAYQWQHTTDERLFWAICAKEKQQNPYLKCEWTKND